MIKFINFFIDIFGSLSIILLSIRAIAMVYNKPDGGATLLLIMTAGMLCFLLGVRAIMLAPGDTTSEKVQNLITKYSIRAKLKVRNLNGKSYRIDKCSDRKVIEFKKRDDQ